MGGARSGSSFPDSAISVSSQTGEQAQGPDSARSQILERRYSRGLASWEQFNSSSVQFALEKQEARDIEKSQIDSRWAGGDGFNARWLIELIRTHIESSP